MSEVVPIDAPSASTAVASTPVLEARALSKRYGDVEAVAVGLHDRRHLVHNAVVGGCIGHFDGHPRDFRESWNGYNSKADIASSFRGGGPRKVIRATVPEVKNGLSAFLRRVKTGESVLVLDRKTPVACIVPVSQVRESRGVDARLARLEAAGVVVRERPGNPLAVLGQPLPAGAKVLDALLEERRDGR